MKVKFNQTEIQNLLLLIKETSSVELTTDDIEIGVVQSHPITKAVETNDPNNKPLGHDSSVRLTAKATSAKYKGSHELNYRRIDIEKQWLILEGSKSVLYTPTLIPVFDETHIKSYIKSVMNYIDSSITLDTTITGETATCVLTPITDSYIYTGTLTLTLTKKPPEKIELSTVVPSEANGFEYETEKASKVVTVHGFDY